MSSVGVNGYDSLVLPQAAQRALEIARSEPAIADMQPALVGLGSLAGQRGAMDDLSYFLGWLKMRRKSPALIFHKQGAETANSLDAAVLLYEHRMAGCRMRIFTVFDPTGRRTLVRRGLDAASFSVQACRSLVDSGAQCVLVSFRDSPEALPDGQKPQAAVARLQQLLEETFTGRVRRLVWASREREFPDYLELTSSFDETLARMGARTRNHLRYYRRRAEKELGVEFVVDPEISREELEELNGNSFYKATKSVMDWRCASRALQLRPRFYGLRGRDGRWLSVVGGLEAGGATEIFWQMNRAELKTFSLGTVMRSFVIEYEIAQGTKRLYFEGGTSHSMSHAFVRGRCTELVVLRDNVLARSIPALMQKFVPPENPLNIFLEEPGLEWRRLRT